jgi:hypothetical protein
VGEAATAALTQSMIPPHPSQHSQLQSDHADKDYVKKPFDHFVIAPQNTLSNKHRIRRPSYDEHLQYQLLCYKNHT